MQHEGSFHLDDVRHLNDDQALRTVLNLKTIPQASSLGTWLRKMSDNKASFSAWEAVNKGYMPMVGQIVACDFRAGNASPARENLKFIQQCQQSLPEGCFIQFLRTDAAGYKIIQYRDKNTVRYAIRAKMLITFRITSEEVFACS